MALLQNHIVVIIVGWVAMMLQVFFYHFISHVTRTPDSITNRPEVFAERNASAIPGTLVATFDSFSLGVF